MKLILKLTTAFLLLFSLPQGVWAVNATNADDACYHNVIRDALNTGKTMNNLWDGLTQKSHNFATEIRPSPTLPFLSNSSSLRSSAASVASSCSYGHSNYPNNGVGENIYYITEKSGKTAAEWALARNGTVERAVNTWSYEAAYYSQSGNSCQSGEQCGHYTQIVWNSSVGSGPTTNVGCVAQFCPNGLVNTSSYPGREATYVVCHYQPQGNYVGVKPYLGTSTSSGSNAAPLSGCSDGSGGSGGSGGGSSSVIPSIIPLLLDD